jgi:putative ABC transport system substrate-binding protein
LKRREFMSLLGSAAVAWPVGARAQQAERTRRIGVLMQFAADDHEAQLRNAALLQGLGELGWTVGRNLRIEYRWGANDGDRIRRYAAEIVAFAPDVIVCTAASILGALQQATRTVPIVFGSAVDPVAGGFVASLARPGGNATGFTLFEFGLSGKWLELLRAVIRDPTLVSGGAQLGAIQSIAPSFGVELSLVDARDEAEIERAITEFAPGSNGGLIVTTSPSAAAHRELIITLAARYRLPAVYPFRYYAASGGLISYGPDTIDQYHRAAGYVDRILKGAKPADLPVQAPTKYELVINLKTAQALGVEIPPMLLARAADVIE